MEPSRSPLIFGVDEVEDINQALVDLVDIVVTSTGWTDVSIQSEVRRGQPVFEVILDYAEEIRADCIVLGRQGISPLPDAVFGGTTDRVTRFADVPMTLVPKAETE